MTRTAFLAWLLELIRNAPEPTAGRALEETDELEPGIEVEIRGTTFRIVVDEVLLDA